MLSGAAVLVLAWAVLLLAAMWLGVRRAKGFDSTVAAAGFVCDEGSPRQTDLFGRSGSTVSRVIKGRINGIETVFFFGSCTGQPLILEGTFDAPRVPIAAALLEAPNPLAWLETWTTERAVEFGWRPAHIAEIDSAGRVLLVWEGFSPARSSFQSCCAALARTSEVSRPPAAWATPLRRL